MARIRWHYCRSGGGVEDVNQLLQERNVMLDELKEQLVKAQNRMKTQVDKHRRGEIVGWRECVPQDPTLQASVLGQKAEPKLSSQYYGPFEVLERIGAVAYRLKLPRVQHPPSFPCVTAEAMHFSHCFESAPA